MSGKTTVKVALPDDVVNDLIALRENLDASRFAVGDLAEEVLAEIGHTLTAEALYREFAAVLGVETRTVRNWHRAAQAVPPAWREQYKTLPFMAFVRCWEVPEERRKAWLEFAAGYIDERKAPFKEVWRVWCDAEAARRAKDKDGDGASEAEGDSAVQDNEDAWALAKQVERERLQYHLRQALSAAQALMVLGVLDGGLVDALEAIYKQVKEALNRAPDTHAGG